MDAWGKAKFRRFSRKLLHIGIALVLTILALGSVAIVATSAFIQLYSWEPANVQETSGESIAVLGNVHDPVVPFTLLRNPSVDLWANANAFDAPSISGVFRVNLINFASNDGEAKIALVLPLHSIFKFGGPGGYLAYQALLGIRTDASIEKGLTCDPALIGPGVADARELEFAVFKNLEWSVDCEPYGPIIWTHLPSEPLVDDARVLTTSQIIVSSSAAMVGFELPQYGGIYRTGFSTWSMSASIESGRSLEGHETQTLAALLRNSDPVIAIDASENTLVSNPEPADYNKEFRRYL